MTDSTPIDTIQPEELSQLILDDNKVVGKDFVVVDVRDNSRAYGYIVDSINVYANIFEEDCSQLIDQIRDVEKVIFHCNRSRSSGPKSAKLYRDALIAKYPDSKQQVLVLEGGFAKFQKEYREDTRLVHSIQTNYWDDFLIRNPL